MRRIAVGLAAAVIAAGVGVAGRAEALPSYIQLSTPSGTLLDTSGNTWLIGSCSFGGTGGCNNFVIYNDGNGIGIAGTPGVGATSFPTLGSEIQGASQDVTVDLFEQTSATFGSGPTTIGAAHLTSVGTTRGGTATITPYYGGVASATTFQIGLPGSNVVPAVNFNPTNVVEYNMDVPLTAGLVTVTYGTPVPEPGAFGLLAIGLLLAAAVRFRPAASA